MDSISTSGSVRFPVVLADLVLWTQRISGRVSWSAGSGENGKRAPNGGDAGSAPASLRPRHRDVAQPGSAPVWGTGGRRFESGYPDQAPLGLTEPHPHGCPVRPRHDGRRGGCSAGMGQESMSTPIIRTSSLSRSCRWQRRSSRPRCMFPGRCRPLSPG